jgi:hypothetical protein
MAYLKSVPLCVPQFFAKAPGVITGLSYYRDLNEPCTGHVGKIFDKSGVEVLRSVSGKDIYASL